MSQSSSRTNAVPQSSTVSAGSHLSTAAATKGKSRATPLAPLVRAEVSFFFFFFAT
jgi:hypothetical protein